jgi:hypothetical protein
VADRRISDVFTLDDRVAIVTGARSTHHRAVTVTTAGSRAPSHILGLDAQPSTDSSLRRQEHQAIRSRGWPRGRA